MTPHGTGCLKVSALILQIFGIKWWPASQPEQSQEPFLVSYINPSPYLVWSTQHIFTSPQRITGDAEDHSGQSGFSPEGVSPELLMISELIIADLKGY